MSKESRRQAKMLRRQQRQQSQQKPLVDMSPAPPDQIHPLVEPRIVAAVGLVALGGGVGVGLMLAKILIVWGLLLALLCAAGIIWIYFQHYWAAYKALTDSKKYHGPSVKELAISFFMVAVLVPLSISVFVISSKEEPNLNRASVMLSSIYRQKFVDVPEEIINIVVSNPGNITAINRTNIVLSALSDHVLDKAELYAEILRMSQALIVNDRKVGPNHTEMRPNSSGFIITLMEKDPDVLWSDVLQRKVIMRPIQAGDEKWSKFLDGKLFLYVLISMNFEDEIIEKRGYWKWNFCGYFVATLNFSHSCAPNNIERVVGSRF